MAEKELFNFGDKELNVNSLIKNITTNQQSYVDYYSDSIPDTKAFNEKVNYIKEGIKNGNITIDKDNKYHDTKGVIDDNDQLMQYALGYVNLIAAEQSKKERSLTKSEIAKQEEDKKLKKEELSRQKAEQEYIESTKKPDFEPQNEWSVAQAFAHSFNQNGQIPYNLLQQLVTTDEKGNSVYTDLHAQLDKNFDLVSKQLQQFNNTESYINSINLFKQALKDGNLSPQDKFLGMELGFKNSELDKLNALIKYKVQVNELSNEQSIEKQENESDILEIPKLQQDPLESNESFKNRVTSIQREHDWYVNLMNKVNFQNFEPAKKIKNDSDKEFIKYLKDYIHNWILHTGDDSLTRKHYYVSPSTIGALSSSTPIPLYNITTESLKYMNPKLYNELGLKFFSNYSASKMYKYFKDLVDKQNQKQSKEKIAEDIKYSKYDPIKNVSVRPEFQDGGIIKAQEGAKTSWRRNYDGTAHQMDAIYKTFIENTEAYDAKQIAESLNKLNTDTYKTLNFENQDNTLGFKSWNTTFNESGLNNLFGYSENKSDYLGPTTKSRQGFVSYLQNLYDPSNPAKIDSIKTGNGSLVFNPNTKQWSYTNWVDPLTKSPENKPTPNILEESANNNGSTGTPILPETRDLTLKDLNLQKPVNYNPHGVWHSLTGYFANEAANAKKREIQKEIPLYQEVMAPEKAFKTAYTYDLEQAKNEVLAEANNIQPITSDAAVYYAAKNDSIKNARAYATKLDTEINNRIQQTKDTNSDIAYANAVNRTQNVNTNAKYRHEWDIEQKQGDIDYIEARNQSFQGLNKEFKHYHVTDSIKKQKERDASMYKHILTGITTSPSNYINGWTKHHDLIWFKGQNGQLETDQEQIEYQQLLALVNQASSTIFDQYNDIEYPGIGQLFAHSSLKESYNPNKHGTVIVGKKGMKIDKQKLGNFINKVK